MTYARAVLRLHQVAELDISAASGIVLTPHGLCVIADDEVQLAVYDTTGKRSARIQLQPRELPEAHDARKREKPDFESIVLLPDGQLLALGSGSTSRRQAAALIEPAQSGSGGSHWSVQRIALHALYAALGKQLSELNIEGAAISGNRLWLAQRGNAAAAQNALVELDLARTLASLDADHAIAADALLAIHPVQLGTLHDVQLSLTDLCALPDGTLLFSAAAEDTTNTYADGLCVGSVIGTLTKLADSYRADALKEVTPTCKIEGLCLASSLLSPDARRLWLVADPDDRTQRAPLFSADYAR